MVDFRSLEVFYWVATLESFGRAAERLYTTQPAVSQRIAALEEEFGGRLLERSGRATRPTPRGRQLLGYADRLLRLRTEMIRNVATPERMSGLIRLGVSETIVHTWLSDFIGVVSRRYPLVTFDIEVDVTPKLRAGLARQELDLAFLAGPVNEPDIVDLDLGSVPLSFICDSGRRFEAEPVPAAELARHAFVTYQKNSQVFLQIQQAFHAATATTPRIHASSSLATIVRMALDGIGIAIIPTSVIGPELARGELRRLDTMLDMPPLRFTASYRLSPDAILVPALAEISGEVARNHAGTHKPG
ncbi:LysR family transcriptional regulator [Roseomonas sp. NAR14]|uniref:LysR family transcriptional regulator n=1 Tax=Roseomonas acroporae TaxID=2937791 RepID=A0A9X1YCQ6_9PROT|nr:LysR family transcriptional regulator [Roseomonas acroporae]MCK8787746.1 LysR family transcriptional regulator [Roseomonas acroporae]